MARRRPFFQPPFCPNPRCDSRASSRPWRFKKKGFYTRLRGPRRVQRYVCRSCQRNFSSQTFSTTYWQKRPDVMPKLFDLTCGSMGNRQIANALKVAPTTIDRQLNRLGRHCALFFEEAKLECQIKRQKMDNMTAAGYSYNFAERSLGRDSGGTHRLWGGHQACGSGP